MYISVMYRFFVGMHFRALSIHFPSSSISDMTEIDFPTPFFSSRFAGSEFRKRAFLINATDQSSEGQKRWRLKKVCDKYGSHTFVRYFPSLIAITG